MPSYATLLRKSLPARALAVTGTAKNLRKGKAARIAAECGAGKTFMSLGTIHILAEGCPCAALVMCLSHSTHKWARGVLLTIPRARTFLTLGLSEDTATAPNALQHGANPMIDHAEVRLSVRGPEAVT